MPAIITLTTDFGVLDYYVAAVKGKILQQVNPVAFVDISHQIPNGDIAQAAYTLRFVYPDFPPGTIHIAAVGTHTNTDSHLLVLSEGQYFLMPDNGIVGLLFAALPSEIYRLHLTESYNASFPSKTLYTEVAAKIIAGATADSVGEKTEEYLTKRYATVQTDEETIRGHIVHVDAYGNLISNISEGLIKEWAKDTKFEIQFGHEKIYRIAKNFTGCDFGDCIVLYNHAQQLMIGIRQGNAAQLLGMRYDSSVIVKKVK